jgi:hypothetical protein
MASEHIATYLNDHLAGSVVALELLEHMEKAHAGTNLASFLAGLRSDIEADRKQLEELMAQLQVSASAPRKATAWIAEKLTQLKLRLDDPTGGPLRLLEVADAVSVGIEGKRLLWRALSAAAVPAPPRADYERLTQRAEEQRARLETVRLDAARAAFGVS